MTEQNNKTYLIGFILALSAGLIWSFGAPTVRYMVDAQVYQWHYLFYRGIVVATILLIYLIYNEGISFYHNFNRVGSSGLLGGIGLAAAFIFFIFGMTYTSAATTLFMIGTQPLFAGLFAYIFLMAYNDWYAGTFLGWVFGLFCSIGFAIFATTLRWQPDTPKFTTIIIAGIACSLFSMIMIVLFADSYSMPLQNILLSMLHGTLVGIGLILLSLGARYLPAAEFMLLSLTEVVGGVIWCWIPLFGVNEVPSNITLMGGLVIIIAISFYAFGTTKKTTPPTL